jgi:DNA-directed RNA polymerase specialized sigma24 family protein
MVTKNEIISKLYNDQDIANAIAKMNPVELQDDLRQEMFLVLCEMDDTRLIEMHKNGFLKYYLVRTMLTMIKSDRSTFHNKFRRIFEEIGCAVEDKPVPVDENNEALHVGIETVMKELHWYENGIFKLYAENKNISELSRQTSIPYRSLSKTISDTRKKIKSKMKEKSAQGYQLVHANLEMIIEVDAALDPSDVADAMEYMTAYFREKMQGMVKNRMMIKKIKDIRISHIQS